MMQRSGMTLAAAAALSTIPAHFTEAFDLGMGVALKAVAEASEARLCQMLMEGMLKRMEESKAKPPSKLEKLLAEQRNLQRKLSRVGDQIAEQPCAGCGNPLETSEPGGCEHCEGRFCEGCVSYFEDASGDGLHFCNACAPKFEHRPEVAADAH